jgi:hypothetical protein
VSLPELVMWATVLGVGIPSAWRNPTAGALVVAWFAGQAAYLATGDSLPLDFYLFPDLLVLAVIFSKQEACNLAPYRNAWHQLKCVLLERSVADRIVVLIFPLMWLLYCLPMPDWHKWWALYFLALAQFFAAGTEAFNSHRRDADAADQPETLGDLLVAYRNRGYG